MDDNTWMNCPHCGLKHRPRAQSLCPRCGRSTASSTALPSVTAMARASMTVPSVPERTATPIASVPAVRVSPASAPTSPREPEYTPTVEYIPSLEPAPARQRLSSAEPESQARPASEVSSAIRVGGAILLVNAVLHLFEFLFLPSVSTDASLRAAQLAGTLVGVGLDALLGVNFLLGRTQLRTVALVRLVVGMFLFGGMSLYQAHYLFTLVVFAFSCGTLVLVWGKPSAFLAGVGLTAVLVGVSVELIGFSRLANIQPLSDRAKIALLPELEGRQLGEAESIVGERHPYKLRVPSNGWYRRKGEAARNTDASVDVALFQPDHGATMKVAVRRWNEADTADLREARNLELRNLRVQYPDFQLAETSDNGTPLQDASLATLSGSAAHQGKPFLFEVSLYKTGDKLLLVTAAAPTSSFELLHLQGATATLRAD